MAASRRSRRTALALAAVLTAAPLLLGSQVAAGATGPTAVDDTATVETGFAVGLAGATNDQAGSAPISPGLTVFPTDGQPNGSTVGVGGKTIQVPQHGTFTLHPDGSVTFKAWTQLTGTVSVRYRITDAAGATDDGLLTVVATAGGTVDDVTTDFGTEVGVVDLLANDTPGRNADGTPGTLDRTLVRFSTQLFDEVTISDDGHTATVAHLGVATLDDQGLLTWRAYPSSSDFGISEDLRYTAQDTTRAADGSTEHHSYITRAVVGGNYNTDPNRPLTTDDEAATPFDASVTLPGSQDDRSHDPTGVLLPQDDSFKVSQLEDVGAVGPDDHLAPDGHKVKFPGRGSWTINPDGTVLYVPRRGFVGRDAVNMVVVDDEHHRGVEELVVTVEPGPQASPDRATTQQDVTTSVPVLDDDTPGSDADGTAGSMDATFVRFPTDGQPAGATVSAYARTLTVPGQGVYTADRVTGVVRFDPEPAFTGTASPVTYSARDTVTRTDGRVVHNPVTATLTVTVTAVTPVALDNWISTPAATPVEIPVLANDEPGAASAPLVASSVRLRLAPGLPDGSRLSGDAKTLVVGGEGTFVARTDGVVVFSPATGFIGQVPTIGYQVADAHGTTARASITVQVRKASA